ncbi:ATP-binding protein [Candidatus Pacearchaeota archaeon]|nr:ATP-binding protein [Candidatus Pacearchaeota archaeon]
MAYDIVIGRNKNDQKKFKNKGVIYLGKGYVQMGNYTSLSNRIFLDVVKSHVILISGKRGSGKSYSISVMAEELSDLPKEVANNIAPIIFDTMGIFWTMKYKNDKEINLLENWNLKPRNLPVTVWVPHGYYEDYEKREIPVDKKFSLKVSELDIDDWITTFQLNMIEPTSVLIQKIISELSQNTDYDIDDIINKIKESKKDEKIKESAISLFQAAKSWKVFANKNEQSTKITDLISRGKTTILDISVYPSTSTFNVRALLIGLISKKIFQHRMLARKAEEIENLLYGLDQNSDKKEVPLVWMFIDEAHEFLPKDSSTPATNSLIQLLREGRQPGISLVLATQQPGVIHRDVMTQSDIVISHRLTNKKDIEALNEIMQTYFLHTIQKSMNNLPREKGAAIILDDNSERLFSVKVRPKFTWHGGETPTTIKEIKD